MYKLNLILIGVFVATNCLAQTADSPKEKIMGVCSAVYGPFTSVEFNATSFCAETGVISQNRGSSVLESIVQACQAPADIAFYMNQVNTKPEALINLEPIYTAEGKCLRFLAQATDDTPSIQELIGCTFEIEGFRLRNPNYNTDLGISKCFRGQSLTQGVRAFLRTIE